MANDTVGPMQESAVLSRLERLREMTEESPRLSQDARDRTIRLLGTLAELATDFPSVLARQGIQGVGFVERIDSDLGRLPPLLASGDEARVLAWVRGINRALASHLMVTEEPDKDTKLGFPGRGLLKSLDEEHNRLALLEDEANFRRRAERLVEQAEDTAERLQQAAGMGGEAALSEFFEEYAANELRSANWFRGFAIGAIISALLVAVFLEHPEAGDWVNFSYRLAQLAGIAALATYFGRQAGQHRRVYNWAKSLQVQLQSFPLFVAPVVDESTRDEIYSAFARRVLGAPPERAASSSDDVYPTQQLVDLATSIVKKSS